VAIFPVVLDTCVIYPPVLRDTLFRAAESGLFQLRLSDEIINELIRNYQKREGIDQQKLLRLEEQIRGAFPDFANPPSSLITSMTNQEKDRHVLASAVLSGAKVLVTKNIKDFPPHSVEPFGIEVQTPDEFLVHLYHLNKNQMVQVIWNQASDKKKPPRTASDILAHLGKHTPGFSKLCDPHIADIEEQLGGFKIN
jgi:predicted nucleic acid-binding protein